MLDIEQILKKKRLALITGTAPLEVDFSMDEIEVLNSVPHLQQFRIMNGNNSVFAEFKDVFECAEKVCMDDHLSYVLEYCVMRNPILRKNAQTVFPQLRKVIS